MNILIVGNMGYVGPVLVEALAERYPETTLDGFDNAYFAHCLTGAPVLPERHLRTQYFGDVRHIEAEHLEGYSAVVDLAAVSNDPMGHRFAEVTARINAQAAVELARKASIAGVGHFVLASSCSLYGVASGPPRRESDPVAPITDYAISKVEAERGLAALDSEMIITCLRFATACGMSPRLRLDLVLNDFVANALATGEIRVLSDGSPWRPLIDVRDMARAIDWAMQRSERDGGRVLNINAGANASNYQVRELAHAVADVLPSVEVSINHEAPVDSRSYRVDFGLFERLAPDHLPAMTLADSIHGLVTGLQGMGFDDKAFRSSDLMRLNVLQGHIERGWLTEQLEWVRQSDVTNQRAGEV
ncbi:NAD-dependent epimerase/dehydratase family protein [Halomonas ramblicola]|uniref:NAD-dependent epimerase/dehydratase family protein n=1 Tax=Halomonas ramblicola TaxID=747349 RepID=UPI0025B33A13|nr:SDR family oxidoreductase [Halomonas ramblicola]MDN3522064.1 SDR family oxidoreductase [Halomonas ramblicola]